MVGTDDAAALAGGSVEQRSGAMQTDIAEGARHTVAAANHEDALADELEGVEIADRGNVIQMANHLPGRGEDPFPLGGKKAGVGIDPSRQAEILIGIGDGDIGHRRAPGQRPRRARPIAVGRLRSRRISRAALRPGLPETPPPGWVPAPHI